MTREKLEQLRLEAKKFKEKAIEELKNNHSKNAIKYIEKFEEARWIFFEAQQKLIKIDAEYEKEYLGF